MGNLEQSDYTGIANALTDALKAAGFGNGNGNIQVQEILRRHDDGTAMTPAEIQAEIKQVTDILKTTAKMQMENQKQLNRNEASKYHKKLVKDGVGEKFWDIAGKQERKRALIAREKADFGYSKTEMREANIKEWFGKISKGILEGYDAIFNWQMANAKSQLAFDKNVAKRSNELRKNELELFSALVSSAGTSLTSLATQNATAAAKSMTQVAKDEAMARIKNIQNIALIEKDFEISELQRRNEEFSAKSEALVSGFNAISSLLPGWGGLVGGVLTNIVSSVSKKEAANQQLVIERAGIVKEMMSEMQNQFNSTVESVRKFSDAFDEVANNIIEVAKQNDDKFRRTGAAMGYGGDSYASYMRKVAVEAAKTFGIEAEQLIQMQNSYINASGRNVLMNDDNFNQMEAISRSFGISQSEVSSMMGQMNIFNTSIEDGYDMMNDMWHVATKIGVSTSKFSKDLTNNLKLAQKYNFKGGVDNMAKLTMWAEKTRFNLQNATNFADKMMSNNISDVLETSAKLQVLGGNAAIYADPMAMMWEAGNDVGALAKRQAAMFADITGSFNSKTGETTFTETDLRMIKARAEAMGMNYEDVLNQKRQSNKQGVINKALARYGLDDDLLTGIGNRATYNSKQGKFTVKTVDGKERGIDELAQMAKNGVDVENMLLPEDTDSAIMDIAKNVRSMLDIEKSTTAYGMAEGALREDGSIRDMVSSITSKQLELFNDKDYQKQVHESINFMKEASITEANNTLEFTRNSSKLLDEYREGVMKTIKESLPIPEKIGYVMKLFSDNLNIMEALNDINTLRYQTDKDLKATARTNLKNNLAGQSPETIKALLEFARVDDTFVTSELNFLSEILNVKNALPPKTNGGSVRANLNDIDMTDDAIGRTNGGYLSGASVTPINDGVGTLVKTHSSDQFIAAKSGGPIDKLFDVVSSIIANGNGNSTNNIKLDLSGNININGSGGSVDIVSTLKNDPIAMRDLIRLLIKSMDAAEHGKVSKNHYI